MKNKAKSSQRQLPVTEYSFQHSLLKIKKRRIEGGLLNKQSSEEFKIRKIKRNNRSSVMDYSRLSTSATVSMSPKRMNQTLNLLPHKNINVYEIKPIEAINKNLNLRNSNLFKNKLFSEAYKASLWQFKKRGNLNYTPEKGGFKMKPKKSKN
mmetsp:Transcript_17123/g.15095  ORF Transcript_17123/g.15095 Transcript_17123/m.15095 type:complete len:152 (-) Transcript_17123:299-754(-)